MIEPIENLLALELDMLTYGENMSTLNGIRIDPSAFCIIDSDGAKPRKTKKARAPRKQFKKDSPKQNYLKLANNPCKSR